MGRIKEILLSIAFTLFVLPCIFFSEIISVKAISGPYEIYDPEQLEQKLQSLGVTCQNVVVMQLGDSTNYAYCINRYAVSPIDNNYFYGNIYVNRYSNFYGISALYNERGNFYFDIILRYNKNNNTWEENCGGGSCSSYWSTFGDKNNVVIAFLNRNSNSVGTYTYNSYNSGEFLFGIGYNLKYYESIINQQGVVYTNYFERPDSVTGSHNDYITNELSSTTLNFTSTYGMYNSYMYDIDSITDSNKLLGVQFNYDDTNSHYLSLDFILTYKSLVTPIVQLISNNVVYSCTSTYTKTEYDINYQHYVHCPSVDISSGGFSIRVQDVYQSEAIEGPVRWYNNNVILYTSDGIVGISPIYYNNTDIVPTPVIPDTPSEPDINDSINNMNDNIMDPSGPDTSSLANSAGWLPPGPVDSIINLPITMLQSLNNVLSTSSCSPISIPIPFINYNYSLPCINTIISNMGFAFWWESIGTIASAFILYKYLINLYAWVDKTLTFRQNNWNDWGGI